MTREERIRAMGEGPWVDEPDHLEFRAHGLPCIVHRALHFGPDGRNQGGGHWRGYVGVPPGHPWHGKKLDQEHCDEIDVHGGITYASLCHGHICHVPAPGEPDDVWWLGFDASHHRDLQPATRQLLREIGHLDDFHRVDVYRNLEYMRGECEQLAAQAVRRAQAAP